MTKLWSQIQKLNCSIAIVIIGILISACGQDVFSPSRTEQTHQSADRDRFSYSACAKFSLIKPEVDFLFIWDNSTSTYFINDQTKSALNNTIDLISAQFDYHIMVAPLIGNGNDNAFFMSETPDGLSGNAHSIRIDRSHAGAYLDSIPRRDGSAEHGLERTVELLQNNQGNGIFRENAYTMIVIMSNTDDTYWYGDFDQESLHVADEYIAEKKEELLCIRGNYSGNCSGFNSLDSQQMRFMSIVLHQPSTTCPGIIQGKENYVYRKMSHEIYYAPYTDGRATPSDQSHRIASGKPADSYNICDHSDYTHIFDGINNSIQAQIEKHRYNYWPVATAGADPISPNEISVMKNNGNTYNQLTPPVVAGQNGFTFNNSVQTVNTRYEPTPGEPFTGYVIELHGDARVEYPECMQVETISPKEYFGYVNMDEKPQEDSIQLYINGEEISKSSTNGWQLIKEGSNPKYFSSKNIRIEGPNNDNPATPAVNRSGYFLKLYGDAIYSNGAIIDLSYLSDGN